MTHNRTAVLVFLITVCLCSKIEENEDIFVCVSEVIDWENVKDSYHNRSNPYTECEPRKTVFSMTSESYTDRALECFKKKNLKTINTETTVINLSRYDTLKSKVKGDRVAIRIWVLIGRSTLLGLLKKESETQSLEQLGHKIIGKFVWGNVSFKNTLTTFTKPPNFDLYQVNSKSLLSAEPFTLLTTRSCLVLPKKEMIIEHLSWKLKSIPSFSPFNIAIDNNNNFTMTPPITLEFTCSDGVYCNGIEGYDGIKNQCVSKVRKEDMCDLKIMKNMVGRTVSVLPVNDTSYNSEYSCVTAFFCEEKSDSCSIDELESTCQHILPTLCTEKEKSKYCGNKCSDVSVCIPNQYDQPDFGGDTSFMNIQNQYMVSDPFLVSCRSRGFCPLHYQCTTGTICDPDINECYEPMLPGTCKNAWILMQMGVDSNGNTYVPKKGDTVRNIGGGLDQSRTYPVPMDRVYKRYVNGLLSDAPYNKPTSRSRIQCGLPGAPITYYVFEIQQLTGVSITVTGEDKDNGFEFSSKWAEWWGSLDTVIEIRHFDAQCSKLKKNNQVHYDFSSDLNHTQSSALPSDHNHQECNDDGSKSLGPSYTPNSMTLTHGYGSRLEKWLAIGKYVLVVSGYEPKSFGIFQIEFNSVPNCLPNCAHRQCGLDPTCKISCGDCQRMSNYVKDEDNYCDPILQICVSKVKKDVVEEKDPEIKNIPEKKPSLWENDKKGLKRNLPDLKLKLLAESHTKPYTFQWVTLKADDNEGCLHTKPNNFKNSINHLPCFNGAGDRLLMFLNISTINQGHEDFVMHTNKNKNEKISISKCLGWSYLFPLGFLRVTLSIPLISKVLVFPYNLSSVRNIPFNVSQSDTESGFSPQMIERLTIQSKIPVYDTSFPVSEHMSAFRKQKNNTGTSDKTLCDWAHLNNEDTEDNNPFQRGISVGHSWDTISFNTNPCTWYDITPLIQTMSTLIKPRHPWLLTHDTHVYVTIEVNPNKVIKEITFENNVASFYIPIKDIPLINTKN